MLHIRKLHSSNPQNILVLIKACAWPKGETTLINIVMLFVERSDQPMIALMICDDKYMKEHLANYQNIGLEVPLLFRSLTSLDNIFFH